MQAFPRSCLRFFEEWFEAWNKTQVVGHVLGSAEEKRGLSLQQVMVHAVRYKVINQGSEPSAMSTVGSSENVLMVQTSAKAQHPCHRSITTEDLKMGGLCSFSASKFEGFNQSQVKALLQVLSSH